MQAVICRPRLGGCPTIDLNQACDDTSAVPSGSGRVPATSRPVADTRNSVLAGATKRSLCSMRIVTAMRSVVEMSTARNQLNVRSARSSHSCSRAARSPVSTPIDSEARCQRASASNRT